MHKNEKVVFLFPSHIAYGYHGDEKKIGTNQPLLCAVTLHNFISEAAFKKEILLKQTDAVEQISDEESIIPKKPTKTSKDTLTN